MNTTQERPKKERKARNIVLTDKACDIARTIAAERGLPNISTAIETVLREVAGRSGK